jgi:hypothetical protein
MRRGATFDATSTYRYSLWRTWDGSLPRVAFIMLNPSTADHRTDDPTIRRCMDFGRRWGYGSVLVVNLFAYRTPSPAELARARHPIGPENDRYLMAAGRRSAAVVAAWGVHGALHGRDAQVLELLGLRRRKPLLCLGTTSAGHPRHPLYLHRETRPMPFVTPARAGRGHGRQ